MIESEGLRLLNSETGSAQALPFGTSRHAAMTALAFQGPPTSSGTLEECGAGPLDQASWPDGLTLYFQESKFAGWALGQDATGSLVTAAGIGIGSTRSELAKAYSAKIFESTLGTEFDAGGLFGILDSRDPSAKITTFWAGVSCMMR